MWLHGWQVSKLHSLLRPFLLRRIKSDVEDSLPLKAEILLYAHMAPDQKRLNEQLCDRTVNVRPAIAPHHASLHPSCLSDSVTGQALCRDMPACMQSICAVVTRACQRALQGSVGMESCRV